MNIVNFSVLTPAEALKAATDVMALHEYWIKRAPDPVTSFTLGAATYLDAKIHDLEYKSKAQIYNPILEKNFRWLYTKLIDELTLHFGSMKLNPNLAYPGFHIFGALPGESITDHGCRLMEQPLASVHVDAPYRAHMQEWKKFQNIDFLNPLSITLCLKLPKHGGGLNSWQNIDKVVDFLGYKMIDFKFNKQALKYFKYLPYETGFVYISTGHAIHQIAPAKMMLPTDRRITLQAHAIKCDGIWQLFF